VGFEALQSNTTGGNNTAIGSFAGPDPNSLNLIYATAIGANATVSESNALVLGGTGFSAVKVGIGTPAPTNVLTIAQGAGVAVSDGWSTYSSQRWKTNVHTLQGALTTVTQLRGVSYDSTTTGNHEIGVIAEEVGRVVPEIVSWEPNGKDAQSVDYSRLSALLVEAMKEQQRVAERDHTMLVKALQQIKTLQAVLNTQAAEMETLHTEIREAREVTRQTKPNLDNIRFTMRR
jgi:hypothetical protein